MEVLLIKLNFLLIVCRCRHEGGGAHRDCVGYVKLWWDDQTKVHRNPRKVKDSSKIFHQNATWHNHS